jgi:hypothetical protein
MKLITMVLSVFMLCVTPFVSAGTQHASVVPVSAEPITVSDQAKMIAEGPTDFTPSVEYFKAGARDSVEEFFDFAVFFIIKAPFYLVGSGFVIHGVVAMFREDGKPMMSLLVGAGLMTVPYLLTHSDETMKESSAAHTY